MLTQQKLQEIFSYDPDSGEFIRIKRVRARDRVGQRAGASTTNGYRCIGIDGKTYLEHRLAWLYMTGEWPVNQIDHVNMNRSDNRFANLREATASENKYNAKARGGAMASKSGLKGVHWNARINRWAARITVNGKMRCLGHSTCPAAASFIYQIEADKLHKNFARAF